MPRSSRSMMPRRTGQGRASICARVSRRAAEGEGSERFFIAETEWQRIELTQQQSETICDVTLNTSKQRANTQLLACARRSTLPK